MQPSQMITFHCPSCGMKLQVPEQMAGVTGPCPQCAANIIAPQSAPPATTPMAPAATTPQAQPPAQQQPPQTQPQASVQQPVATAPQVQQAQPSPQQPAPAPLQKREAAPPATDAPASRDAPLVNKVHRGHSHAPSRPRWMRVVFPLAFLLVAAVLVLVVLQAVGFVDLWQSGKENTSATLPPDSGKEAPGTPADTGEKEAEPSEPTASVQPGDTSSPPVAPPPAPAPSGTAPGAPSTPPSSTETPAPGEFPDLSPPPPGDLTSKPSATPPATATADSPPLPDAKNPPKAGSLVKKPRFKANEVLDQFLAAKTLDERLPLMTKSSRTHEELMASCLAKPLKPLKSNYFSEMVPRLEDDMRQYLYYVAFEDKQEPRERMRMVVQLVERPGIHPPRVHADAFIEHYEKLLDAYAQTPSKKITTFHCIAEARTADLVKNLPEDLKKQMIRLVVMSQPGSKPCFDAFLNKNSPLMERIGARGDFPYVEPRFCVLSFRWNTKDEKHPYIELVDIVTMGWEK